MTRSITCVLVALFLAACADAGGVSGEFTVRDSAGIAIAESTAPAWDDGEGWTVSADPVLQIGMLDGPPEYQLDRVAGAHRLPDGGIVLATGGTEIRFYDPEGRYVRTVGRQGDGPGEFQSISRLFVDGDSLFVFDQRARRLSVFDGAGRFARSFTAEATEATAFPRLVGRLRGGSFVATMGRVFGPGGVEGGFSRDPVTVVRYDADGGAHDTIATVAGHESFVQTRDRGFTVTSLLFGRNPLIAVSGDLVALGGNDSYEIAVHDSTGDVVRIVRRAQDPRPVTDADWNALRAERLEPLEGDWRPTIESMIAEMPRPPFMPFYSGGALDDEGNLWVEDYTAPGDAANVWSVFDGQGRWLGGVTLPERFRVTHVGSDFVVGIWEDDLDVQYVRVHSLVKP